MNSAMNTNRLAIAAADGSPSPSLSALLADIEAGAAVARDIIDRKLAEEMVREADLRKDEFLAVLAHELRNPLAPVRNSLHILRQTNALDMDARRVLDILERQVKHMVGLVDDLVEVSRLSRGRVELKRESTDLADVVRAAVEASTPAIEAAEHELSVTLEGGPLIVHGAPARLTQVLSNLLNNAAKFTDRGGRIALRARREGAEAVLVVSDNGVGIPPEMLHSVFDMFVQVDRNGERGQAGLGIGLTLVKSLTEAHGGTVTVKSAGAGQGSEFTVRLPLLADAAREGAGKRQTPTTAPLTDLEARRVLVVDDNADVGVTTGMLLRRWGAEVMVVRSGAEALELLQSWRANAVLLDIGMPEMNGYEVARRIRRMPEMEGVVLIAMSGWGRETDRKEAAAAGFDHHLIKPADMADLHRILVSLQPRTAS